MTDYFSSGSRLVEPSGDPRRQAVDSLRGYAYQLYVSALAWLRLQSEERLYLEVAEDFAVVGRAALEGVQVKDTSGSGRVTINSEDILQALTAFVDLVERNLHAKVNLRFLSTSEIGIEKSREDRAEGQAVLAYWRKAASGADVAPLRKAILRAEISDAVRSFIRERDDEALRRDLLQRVFWDCGHGALDTVKQDLADALLVYGNDRLRLMPSDVEGLPAIVVGEVLDASLRRDSRARWLDAPALLRLCEGRSRTSIPKSLIEDLVRNLFLSSDGRTIPVVSRKLLERVSAVPMPTDVLPRQHAVQDVLLALSRFPIVFLTAGTGMGKSVLARLVARSRPGEWMVLDLRDLSDEECELRLRAAVGESASMALSGVIVEDINQLNNSWRVASAFGRLVDALHGQDAVCLATCYRPVGGGVLDRVGCGEADCYAVPALNEAEVAHLVQNYRGDPEAWTRVVHERGGQGHPQLVRAALAGLRRRGWPASELEGYASSGAVVDDIESERMSVRRHLVEALEEAPRNLLYRASLLLGRFERQMAITIGGVSPEIRSPGEALDLLVGPWIDSAGRGLLRVSPLVANSGLNVLSREEQLAVHRAAAMFLFTGGTLHVEVGNELFMHALRGGLDNILLSLALAVAKESDEKHRLLGLWLSSLRLASTDRPISTGRADVARALRLAQFLLVVALGDARAPVVWTSLTLEIASEADAMRARMFETMALSKALIASKLPNVFPNWLPLLRRLRALFAEAPELRDIATRAEQSAPLYEGSRATSLGLLFLFNATNVQHVSQQLALFSALDDLSSDERCEYLAFALSTRGGMTSLVNAPWLAEALHGTINGRQAAEQYMQMSALANGWGEQALTIALRVASSVMLDEYANDSECALAMLRAAEAEFGPHFDLARALAKIHFRHRRYTDMLAVVNDLSTQLENFDSLERVFLCRETGIVAAEGCDWPGAAGWFERAYDDAKLLPSERSRRLEIGLLADMALAHYMGGQQQRAIELYAGVLEALPSIDCDDAIESLYLSRVARNGVLWLFLQVIGEDRASLVGEDFATLVPGMCSNVNPPEHIREKELASLDVTWYLFAVVESQVMPPTAVLTRLRSRLGGRQIPSFELLVIERLVEAAICSQAVGDFVALFRPWIDCLVYWERHRDAMTLEQVAQPSYALIPATQASQLASSFIFESTQSAVLGFGIVAACSGDFERIVALRLGLSGTCGVVEAERLLNVMLDMHAISGAAELADLTAVQVRRLMLGTALTLEELFDVTLRFSQVVLKSRFKKPLGDALEQWVRQRWAVQMQSPFGFSTPKLAVLSIHRALEKPGMAGVLALLLAAEHFLRRRLSSALRTYLACIAESMQSSSDALPILESHPVGVPHVLLGDNGEVAELQ